MENLKTIEQAEENASFMTASTHEALKKEYQQAIDAVKKQELAIGEAAGINCDWHDNAAFDHAVFSREVATGTLGLIKAHFDKEIVIIEPRQEVDTVQMGNTVQVKFDDEDEAETFTILGTADAGRQNGWISLKTPVAKALIGHKQGEICEFEVGEEKRSVKIVNILPGNF